MAYLTLPKWLSRTYSYSLKYNIYHYANIAISPIDSLYNDLIIARFLFIPNIYHMEELSTCLLPLSPLSPDQLFNHFENYLFAQSAGLEYNLYYLNISSTYNKLFSQLAAGFRELYLIQNRRKESNYVE